VTRKKAEDALKLSEEQFRRAIEDAPIPIIMQAEDGQVLQLSRTWTELTGYTINDVPDFDTWITKAAYGEGANAVRDHMHALFAGHEKSLNVEFQIRTLDGSLRCWSFSASSPGTLQDGSRFVIGMAVDITEQEKARKEIQDLTKFPNENLSPVLRFNHDGKVIFANPSAQEFLSQWQTKVGGLVPERIHQIVVDSLAAGNRIEFEENCGEELFSFLTAPIAAEGYVNFYGRKITKLKKAEEALLKREEEFRALVKSSSDVVYRISADWKEMQQLQGKDFIPDTEEPSVTWLDKYIHPDDQQRVTAVIKRAIDTKSVFELEHRIIRVDGSLGWTFSRAMPLLDKEGNIIEWLGTAKDITERKNAEEALRVSESKYRGLYNAVSGGVVVQNLEGEIIEANDAACEILGLKRNHISGRTSVDKRWQAIHENGSPFLGEIHPAMVTLKTGKPVRKVVMGVFNVKQEKYRWILVNSEPMLDAEGKICSVATTFLDITEQKRAEEELKRRQAEIQTLFENAPAGLVLFDAKSPYKVTLKESKNEQTLLFIYS
jgi:PAS domain S-box-containing protein